MAYQPDRGMPRDRARMPPETVDPAWSEPRPRRRVGRTILHLLLLGATLALLAAIAWVAFSFTGSSGEDVAAGTPVKVVIPQGADANRIADILAEEGVVRNESMFRARLKINGDGADFRSGSYTMKTGSSYDTIVRVLEKGPAALPTFDISIPEGQRMEETAAHIDRLRAESAAEGAKPLPAFSGAEYLAEVKRRRPPASVKVPRSVRSMEGFLMPATYELLHGATAKTFVDKQLQSFEDTFAEVDMARAAKANLTPYDVVIIASLVEREARLESERPLVSAVIWNRLKIGEPLGIDASNQYDVYEPGSKEFWTASLTESDLARESPYNLRKVGGLPPTPIANPGLASLQAAADPADVDFRYYVANPDGSGEHFFTESYDEFLNHPFQGG